VDLLRQCQHWAHPSRVLPEQATSQASIRGSWLHEVAEATLLGTEAPPPPDGLETGPEIAEVYRVIVQEASHLRLFAVGVEVAYAYDWRSGVARRLQSSGHRDYSDARDTEIPCTLDVLYVEGNGDVVARDWKFGLSAQWNLPAAERAGQLQLQALCYGGPAHGEFTWLEEYPGGYRAVTERAPFDEAGTDLFQLELAALMEKAIAGQPPVPGTHCRYCPYAPTCDATISAAGGLVNNLMAPATGESTPRRTLSLTIQDEGHARWMLGVLGPLKAGIEQLEGRLKAYADSIGGLPSEDGKTRWSGKPVVRPRVTATTSDIGVLVNLGVPFETAVKVKVEDLDARARLALEALGLLKSVEVPTYRWRKQ
jgi:hypothetical protein